MVDIPGNRTTSATVDVGSTVNGSIETIGDHDWFKIELTAGEAVSVSLKGISLEDPFLTIRDANGAVLFSNDDISSGVNRDSLLSFTASYTGVYYIDAGGFDNGYTGTYQLSVSPYTPPPPWSYDKIANQLINGYWNGDAHHFNVSQGDTITVNLTALTVPGQTLAREALALWSDVIGVTFKEVTTGGQIQFDDNEEGAFADGVWSNGITSSAHVNVSTQWLRDYGTSLNGYAFQTYVHEIGHALGLGHAGNYNGDATYQSDALYVNDAWSTTIMSYFDQKDSTYFADQGFSFAWAVTPMTADIVAMSKMYGLSTTTRLGNTTYGFNSTADRDVFDASLYKNIAYTIIDSGGVDTLNYSLIATDQRINLNPETFSNVLGLVGNVSIARGTVIENAVGGSGDDQLIGNAVANKLYGNAGADRLDGGAGADAMYGGAGNDTYVVDNIGDAAVELAGAGTDTVLASVTARLRVDVENLTLTGAYSINGTGNDQVNVIIGNAGPNRLWGLGGNDRLTGNAGNDTIDGGTGADTMIGGVGNDVYYVDSATDVVTELAGEGSDIVHSSITTTLGLNIERLILDATGAISGTGNVLANTLNGNAGANSLSGLDGDDKIYAAGGNDSVNGGLGNDWIEGGAGRDVFTGGTGADRFVFRQGDLGGATASTADRIVDFSHSQGDLMRFDLVDANSSVSGDQAFAFLGTGAFTGHAGELRYQQISGNTFVQGDVDGDGVADFWVQLDGLHSLTASDFLL